MALALNEDQQILQSTAREFVSANAPITHFRTLRDNDDPDGFSRDLWREMSALGWSGLTFAEESGGSGLGYCELGVLFEECGRTLAPTPFLASSVLGAECVRRGLEGDVRDQILGAVALVGSAIAPGTGSAASAGRTAAAVAGTMLLSNGMAQGSEAKIHVEAIRELAASFELEVAPMLVEVEGQTLKLTGTAESQFRDWRELLRELFATETGLEVDDDRAIVQARVI